MSLDKAIEHGKEHRKKYFGAKDVDKSCRNHGSCSWCSGNRQFSNRKRSGIFADSDDCTKWYFTHCIGCQHYQGGEICDIDVMDICSEENDYFE